MISILGYDAGWSALVWHCDRTSIQSYIGSWSSHLAVHRRTVHPLLSGDHSVSEQWPYHTRRSIFLLCGETRRRICSERVSTNCFDQDALCLQHGQVVAPGRVSLELERRVVTLTVHPHISLSPRHKYSQ